MDGTRPARCGAAPQTGGEGLRWAPRSTVVAAARRKAAREGSTHAGATRPPISAGARMARPCALSKWPGRCRRTRTVARTSVHYRETQPHRVKGGSTGVARERVAKTFGPSRPQSFAASRLSPPPSHTCRYIPRSVESETHPQIEQCPDKSTTVAWWTYYRSDGSLNVTAAPRQLQVLRLLRAHRFMDAAQVQQVVFAPVTPRSCQRCLTTLHRKGLVVRVQPARGGWGSGSSGDIYGLSERGAEVLGQHDDAPRERTPHVVDAERFSGQLAQHQLAVNRCFIALWQALEATGSSAETPTRICGCGTSWLGAGR